LKSIHPELAQVAETIHEIDLKKTVNTILVVDALDDFFGNFELSEWQ
jgi:hypothetical protein